MTEIPVLSRRVLGKPGKAGVHGNVQYVLQIQQVVVRGLLRLSHIYIKQGNFVCINHRQ